MTTLPLSPLALRHVCTRLLILFSFIAALTSCRGAEQSATTDDKSIDIVQSEATTDAEESAPKLPTARGLPATYQNYAGSYTDIPRHSIIVQQQDESIEFVATYRSYFDNTSYKSDDVTDLLDTGAGFTQYVKLPMNAGPNWTSITAHVGDFAQDYCGQPTIVYLLQNATVQAGVETGEWGNQFLEKEVAPECALGDFDSWKEERAELAKGPDPFGAFCTIRRECYEQAFKKPERVKQLDLKLLDTLRSLVVE
jgi:hypothetical protein